MTRLFGAFRDAWGDLDVPEYPHVEIDEG